MSVHWREALPRSTTARERPKRCSQWMPFFGSSDPKESAIPMSASCACRSRGDVTVRTPTFSVEVITVPVSDVERALRFYVDQVGFTLDVDYSPNNAFRVVQLTPPGSSCSMQIGNGLTNAPIGSLRNVYLVVTNLEAARSRLL